jgi:hypothetical protein
MPFDANWVVPMPHGKVNTTAPPLRSGGTVVAADMSSAEPPINVPNPDWAFVSLEGETLVPTGSVSGLGLAFAWAEMLPWHVLQR